MDKTTNDSETNAAPPPPGMTLSERHMNPEILAANVRRANYTVYAVLAIVAAVLFIAMALVLWMDYSELMPA